MLSSEWGPSWDPFAEMRRLQGEVNKLLNDAGTLAGLRAYPPVNMWLGDESVVVTAELPGLGSGDVEVSVAEDTLTIRGQRPPAADDKEVAWRRRERATGSFARSVELPFRVDPDRVQARMTNGVLEVELRRPESDLPRKIQVQSG